ncbi:FG-GAP and VCBS repeat-containing protein [Paenibacillus flagellatus]|uniref:VCBS repeat-containing protein n=1 Tax=Paenibacillus flagellatus TaxID=2211139 RepID=A0A2V5K9N0_9BACL|nr:FG-GAP and VCBS repeat-containing protein [Paenibacillus flagellatus]PYI56255.1 hypothetical protein DLM86_04520 [Paenibacillus flagellatus]
MESGAPIRLGYGQWKELGEGLHATAYMLDYYGDGGRDILYATDPFLLGRGVFVYLEDRNERGDIPRYGEAVRLDAIAGSSAMPLATGDDRRFHILAYAGTFPHPDLERLEPDPGWLKLYRNQGAGAEPSFTRTAERVPVGGKSLAEALPGLTQLAIHPVRSASGATDLIVCGREDWMNYWPGGRYGGGLNEHPSMGFGRGYDGQGHWKGRPTTVHIYWLENVGTNGNPEYAAPVPLHRMESLGTTPDAIWFDADGDGVVELVVREEVDRLCLYRMTEDRRVLTESREELGCSPLIRGYFQTSLCACDIDGDGEDELLLTGNPGVVFWLDRQNGRWIEREPLLNRGGHVRGETLSVPCLADMDGDGDLDLVLGDASGFVWYFENRADAAGGFEYRTGIRLSAGKETIHHQAGPTGSLQGPGESRWGYANPLVTDWDGDGRPDLIVNDIKGEYRWYRNAGAGGPPSFEAGTPLLANGEPFRAAWRSRPALWEAGKLVVINRDGFLQFVCKDDRDPRIVHEGELLRYDNRCGIRACGTGGSSGRAALFACDWDGDGVRDLVVGVPASAGSYFNVYLPFYSTVFWLRNIGTDDRPVFQCARPITLLDGTPLDLVWHQSAPWCADLDGDGRPDLACGAEDGKVYVWRRDDLRWDWEPDTDLGSLPKQVR